MQLLMLTTKADRHGCVDAGSIYTPRDGRDEKMLIDGGYAVPFTGEKLKEDQLEMIRQNAFARRESIQIDIAAAMEKATDEAIAKANKTKPGGRDAA